MYFISNFVKIFLKKHHKLSIHALILLSLFFLFTTGCGDSDSVSTETDNTLADAEWFAFQDGDGPWQEIEMPETGIFIPQVTDSEGRYGLAYLTADAAEQRVVLQTLQTTTAELPQVDMSILMESDSAQLQVTVEEPENMTEADVSLYLAGDEDIASDFTFSSTFTEEPGTYDLFVTQKAWLDSYPTGFIALRDIDLTSGTLVEKSISTADFDSSTAFEGPYTISVQGSDGELDSSLYRGNVYLISSNMTEVELGDKNSTDTNLSYSALGSHLTGDDIYLATLDIEVEDADDVYYDAYYYEGFLSEGDMTITPLTDAFDVTFDFDTSTGSMLPGISGIPDIGTGVIVGYMTTFSGNLDDIQYHTRCFVSGGRVQDDTSFSSPDLSGGEGWNENWSIPVDVSTEYVQASVDIGSDSTVIRNVINWFSNDVMRLEDGKWIATLRKIVSYESGGAL